ncbi:MAG TPA: sensor domain-containing diguanylate cyclase [Alphaproteobacteria bacterium]|nr:sensor domain-containing diguanylate cyclase [Alphaproteobacteria bacterium]
MSGAIKKATPVGPAGSHDRLALDRNLQAALIESRKRYKDLVEISSDFAWETDGTAFVFVSPHGALGYGAKDLVGLDVTELLDAKADIADTPFRAAHPVNRVQFWCRAANGEPRRLSCSAMPILDDDGNWMGARGVARDVTEESDIEEALARAHTRERLYNHVLTAVWDTAEPEGMLPAAADAARRALSGDRCLIWRFGTDSADPATDGAAVLAASSGSAAHPVAAHDQTVPPSDLPADGAVERPTGDGHALFARTAGRDGGSGAVAIFRSAGRPAFEADEKRLLTELAFQFGIVMAHVEHQARLDRLARIDGLTGMLVRRAFLQAVDARLGRPGALLYIDLDNFKPVNDLHGHEAGDRVLCLVARQFEKAAGDIGLAARLGGDEFAIWLNDASERDAKAAARRIQRAASDLTAYSADAERPIGFSIGIAVHQPPENGTSAAGETLDALVARADAAMYAVKHAGKNGIHVAPQARTEIGAQENDEEKDEGNDVAEEGTGD